MEAKSQDERVERNLAGEIKPPLSPTDRHDPFDAWKSAKGSSDSWDRSFQLHG